MIFIDNSNSLAHYGVLGMKWGVRKDGKPQGFQYGEKTAKKEAKQKEKAVRDFEANYNKNWVNAYNKAADKSEAELDKINKKYEKYDFSKVDPAHPENLTKKQKDLWNQYVKEVEDNWISTYSEVLLSDFGEHPELGKSWIELAPFMHDWEEWYID